MSIADFLLKKKKAQLAANRAEGADFLNKNKQNDEVITCPSGLQYRALEVGAGPKPTASQRVTCHYEGRLLSGKVFDSSYRRNTPATFPLDRVISGWTEGLQLMPVGSKFIFYIPDHLAYGERQVGSDIPPGSTLIFEVSLLEIH